MDQLSGPAGEVPIRFFSRRQRPSLMKSFGWLRVLSCSVLVSVRAIAQQTSDSLLPLSENSTWAAEGGFVKGTKEFGFSVGGGFGMEVITSKQTHDWVIGAARYGWIFSDQVGPSHWYRGNWELLLELFGGMQFYPDNAYFVGGGPTIRYNFTAGKRWVPFIDLAAGATATDIRNGDLSTTFEFNLQAGVGVHLFLRKEVALTFQYRFIHFSNAGIEFPNLGVNNSTFLAGLTWFF
jgi:lipid A 3-O-deacylase